ncbi:MAG: GerMN domain-containing protein [Clostridiales bacterium]|nr:GerMN domain-containing protein [Clostridiales bacterium]
MSGKVKIAAMAAAAAAVIIALIAAAVIRMDQSMLRKQCELYFLNETKTTLIAESREIKYENPNTLSVAMIEALIDGPQNKSCKPVLGRKTKLLSVDLTQPGSIIADFNEDFISGDEAKDVMAVYAVAKTLCTIDETERVKVTINGGDITTANGTLIDFLSDADINLSTDTNTDETRSVVLYFNEKGTEYLKGEDRTIKVTDQMPLAYYVINELIKGTENEALSDVISRDTQLIGVYITNNICYVNLDVSFINKNSGSEKKQELAVYSIVDSLTELDNIARVQFLIDGKKVERFGKMDFSKLFERNLDIISW